MDRELAEAPEFQVVAQFEFPDGVIPSEAVLQAERWISRTTTYMGAGDPEARW